MTATHDRPATARATGRIVPRAALVTTTSRCGKEPSYRTWPGVSCASNPDLPRDPCDWCAIDGALTTVRVHGDPAPHIHLPVEVQDCCADCAPLVVRLALSEQGEHSRTPIRVEINQ